ncbi:HD domain-containing phosphohydrolase [Brevibacillus sp. NRS-1366]|uniref:HD domain-containing phosphohydrolase n=1 Tax=Brevibacillus sp. NRS-1366 TaxID=3233899 RepID=UPI003D1E8208
MKLRKRNRNHRGYLADAMFYWISILVSMNALMAVILHALGIVMSTWAGMAGLMVCAAVGWTVYVLHKRYLLQETNSFHASAFLGVSLLLFLSLYNPQQFTNMWFVFLLFPIFLSFFYDKVLLLVWGAVSYLLYALSLGLEHSNALSLDIFFHLTVAGASAICAWTCYCTLNRHMGESRRASEEYNREYAITLLNTLVPIVERKTQTSSKEIEQMSRLMKRMLREFPQEKITDWEIKLLSLLHYVSRIKWPDYVFETDEKLTMFEYQVIQEHCRFGREMFGEEPAFGRVVRALQDHHERYDGSGYPDKLKGNDVSLLPQILGIVECFLAMTTPRAYRETITLEEAFEEICSMAGTAYDERVVRAFATAVQIHSLTKVSNSSFKVG